MLGEIGRLILSSIIIGIIVNIKLLLIIDLWGLILGLARENVIFLIFPPLGALIAGLLIWNDKFKGLKGWGPGLDLTLEEIKRGEKPPKPFQALLLKLFAQIIGIGLGNSGGLVGPSGRIGYLLAHGLFKEHAETFSLIALSAGIGAALRAPIGGGLFIFELYYGRFLSRLRKNIRKLIYMEIAFTIGAFISFINFNEFNLLKLENTALDMETLLSLPIIGLTGGVSSYLFVKYYEKVSNLSNKIGKNLKPFLPSLTSLIIVLLVFIFPSLLRFPNILGHGFDNLIVLKDIEPSNAGELLSLSFILILGGLGKIISNGSYVGAGGSGGMIGPSLVTGGLMGGGIFFILHSLGFVSLEDKAFFIAFTATSTLAGAVGSPLSCAILSYEIFSIKSFYLAIIPTLMADLITKSYLKK